MKLAAIDIGTNSIHAIVAEANRDLSFEIIEREKEMAKLGVGVFATKRLSDRAFDLGLDTIRRQVQLADRLGVDDIITAATSAIREARNGEAFLDRVFQETGITPRIISGKEEARLIFLAVRHAIALENDNALVIDIGGGSTELVVGNRQDVLFGSSTKLGVLRLLDMFEDEGAVSKEARGVLEAHIRFIAQNTIKQALDIGFDRVIGTSGTIRTIGEAAHLASGGESLRSVNAEVVQLEDIEKLTQRLLSLKKEKRAKVEGISEKRADAIHLGGFLLVQLLKMAGVKEITLCDASLREGMVLNYLERHPQDVVAFTEQKDLRSRKARQLIQRYDSDWQANRHIADLALQLFDRTKTLHELGKFERDLLEYAALLHDIGEYIRFQRHHKHSRYLVKHGDLRGFNDKEILLIQTIVRYHCKATPTKKHKKFKRLSKPHRHIVRILSGILRIAVGLDKTKNQAVERVSCQVCDKKLIIDVFGAEEINLEVWAARRDRAVLAEALHCEIQIQEQSGTQT
ncbi:Ppx/GppA family phosphatase [Lusitaniella coriacea LEGE 07157]|uniref:Ppx/GppA family phosphatase n=1 Tax=Lusitaniella coriacea LEGE 07157 TaxID=945747 RepID=A0A8J7DX50_9CYAN|nr:Ppx/GppA phosphatase family protein [Lusitaniella coriacea]MBE9116738.1 Ppx/GppA family phosphatase [Lusitaniella coriacea LEGE 07157]